MHLVADAVEAAVNVPFIHIIDETAKRLKASACKRPLLIATRYSMEHGFYQERMRRHNIEVVVPDAARRTRAHNIIFDELCAGKVVSHSRDVLSSLIDKAKTMARMRSGARKSV
jgi:aspartate racemase